jgi:phenylacetate-CoA ligase
VIEDVFEAPVFETYGSREFMMMAGECDRHAGLHLTFEQLLFEIVDDEGRPVPDGVEGNVAITDLYNYGMPFVRYVNGDRAIAGFGGCSCGRGLPTLKQVTGRQLDIVTTPDGRRVPGEFFPHLLKEFAAVRRFQVVQEKLHEVRLRLVLGERDPSVVDAIRNAIGAVLGPEMILTVEVVDDIPLSRSGKLQVVVNRVHPPASPGGLA